MDNLKLEAFAVLGKDPEQSYTPKGKIVTKVSAAVEVGSGDYKKTEWILIWVWGEKFGNLFSNMTKKGTFVWVSGVPNANAWVAKDGEIKKQINLTLKDFRVLRGGKSREEQNNDSSDDNPYEDSVEEEYEA